jgi:hypothetical protein
MKKITSTLVLAIGFFLLTIAVLGEIAGMNGYPNTPPRDWERFDPELARRTHSVNDLIAEAKRRNSGYESMDSENKMIALYEVVIDRFTHSSGAVHTPFTNWILYLGGKTHPAFQQMWQPNDWVARGYSLICSQSSFLLMQMALAEGIRARHVGLFGHVVMEAWYDDDWHLFDPDIEVIARGQNGTLLSVAQLAADPEALRAAYPPYKGSDFESIYRARESTSFVSYPIGSYFEWKSQVLSYVERAIDICQYAIPLMLIIAGLILQRKHQQ